MYTIFIGFIITTIIKFAGGQVSLFDHLNYLASQSHYVQQTYGKQTPYSLDDAMVSSLELALQSCQRAFKWDRWNCPKTDFIIRRNVKVLLIDREDSYINAITTAALMFTITKNCSNGIIAGCGKCLDNQNSSHCSDNPKASIKLFQEYVNADFTNDFYGKISKHNFQAVSNLLEKSLRKECICSVMSFIGVCVKELCLQILKPFDDIALDIRRMYDESLQLNNTPEISRIMWENIPLESLVYTKVSPNYCEPEAVPHWSGMRGRQCSSGDSEQLTDEERRQCQQLCHECGFTARPEKNIIKSICNCKFTWNFQVQCEKCVKVQWPYYCY